MFPDEFGRLAFVLGYGEGGTPMRFSTEGRDFLKTILRDDNPWRLIYGGRQVGKSVTIGVHQGSKAVLTAPRRGLYIAPTKIQASEFSSAKFDDIYNRSPILEVFHDRRSRSVTEKRYIHGSRLTLRYAFRHADRIRGISADDIMPDEVQDMDPDVLPVIYEAAFRSPDPTFLLAGTQKSVDGTLQDIIKRECQHLEWVIPCEHHTPVKWNVLDEDNLDFKDFKMKCRYCHRPLDMKHKQAQWVVTQSAAPGLDSPMNAYRICQPMEPTARLDDAVRKVVTGQYTVTRYKNEVWARPHQHAKQPLTRDDVRRCCWDELVGWPMTMAADARRMCGEMSQVFLGVDWGAGTEASHTLAVVGGYFRGKPTIVHAERVSIPGSIIAQIENDEIDRIKHLHDTFGVDTMACDFGLGYGRNMDLIKQYGVRKVVRVMLLNQTKMCTVDEEEGYLKVSKSLLYDRVVSLIRRREIVLPPWPEFVNPFADDITNIRREGGDGTSVIYTRPSGKPDDTFSAIVFFVVILAIRYKLTNILSLEQ